MVTVASTICAYTFFFHVNFVLSLILCSIEYRFLKFSSATNIINSCLMSLLMAVQCILLILFIFAKKIYMKN